MSKRFIISEDEKKQIRGMYNLNEDWLDDTLEFLKDVGEDAVDFIKDKLDLDDDSDESVEDMDFSKDEKEKIDKEINIVKSEKFKFESGDGKISPVDLYRKLDSILNNKKLSIALVANAAKESGFKCKSRGDGGDYAKKHPESSIGGYCSFGLWQYNICGGLGIALLKEYGVEDESPEEKMKVLSDCDKQIKFMAKHVQSKKPSGDKGIKGWIDWIVDNVERPKNREEAKRSRNSWSISNIDMFDAGDEIKKSLRV